MAFGVDSTLILSVVCIFMFAGVVKGILGFGLPIVTMSLLPFVIPVDMAIVISAFVQPATNIFQLISTGDLKRSVHTTWPVLVALVPGILLGAWYLTSLDSNTLLIVIGITIIGFSALNLAGYKMNISLSNKAPIGLAFGFVAGIFGALTSLNGWAFILYLMGLNVDRNQFRSSIALLFLVSGFLISSSFWVIGWLDLERAVIGILALVAAIPGMVAGNRIGEKLSGDLFRMLILYALVVIGFALLLQGIAALLAP